MFLSFIRIYLSLLEGQYNCYLIIYRIRVVVRVQDETGSSSFVLFERHLKDLIHRGKQWLMDKIAKV